MIVTKGLIVADPWIGYILDGTKTWEMRSTAARYRGWFGLIRKGTGAVHGVARLVDVLPPISPEEMLANVDKHRIPPEMIRSGEVAKWNTPWLLADVSRLPQPVSYSHRSGAVTWVELEKDVSRAITAQLGELPPDIETCVETPPSTKPASAPALRTISPCIATETLAQGAVGTLIGRTELTEGNIKNNHFYLRRFIDRFPADTIGGSNRAQKAPREVTVDWKGALPVMTDIDGQKKFFRQRGWIRSFFERNDARPGDVVRVEETGPYTYCVRIEKGDRE